MTQLWVLSSLLAMHELTAEGLAPLAIIRRDGLNESFHLGTAALVAPDGQVLDVVGDAAALIYPRSALKPVQAMVMRDLGLKTDSKQSVISMASHYATQEQIDLVRGLLSDHGNSETDLGCPEAWPWNPESNALAHNQSRIYMNCSGKHAGFLATAKLNSFSTSDYLSPEHPVQQRVKALIQELSGEQIVKTTVDGCGAPLFAMSTIGLARALAQLPVRDPDLFEAGLAHPHLIGDTTTPDALLMKHGVFSKLGAEGVFTAVTKSGHAVAIKFADGSLRAALKTTAALFHKHGLIDSATFKAIEAEDSLQVLGGGKVIGEIKICI
ncbi:MAG: hypothetical protein RIS08_841 [Actinomycetota bacterium]|jgi:L-asparaginase II